MLLHLQEIRVRMRATTEEVRRALADDDFAAFQAAMEANEASFDALGKLFATVLVPAGRAPLDATRRAAAIEAALGLQAEHAALGELVSGARQQAALAVAESRRTPLDGYELPVPGVALDRRG